MNNKVISIKKIIKGCCVATHVSRISFRSGSSYVLFIDENVSGFRVII